EAIPVRQVTRPGSILDRPLAVPQSVVGTGGQQPGEVVQGENVLRGETDGFGVVADGFFILFFLLEGESPSGVGSSLLVVLQVVTEQSNRFVVILIVEGRHALCEDKPGLTSGKLLLPPFGSDRPPQRRLLFPLESELLVLAPCVLPFVED